jgi:hypothetical protein
MLDTCGSTAHCNDIFIGIYSFIQGWEYLRAALGLLRILKRLERKHGRAGQSQGKHLNAALLAWAGDNKDMRCRLPVVPGLLLIYDTLECANLTDRNAQYHSLLPFAPARGSRSTASAIPALA